MSLSDRKRRACEEISAWLKEADIKAGNTVNSNAFYLAEAEKRIKGFHWQLYKLNRPFVWLEKKVIEPLDLWSDRANLFQFFAKVSPVIEAIGVLAIPFVLFIYESQREARQITFEQNVITSQAVRGYVSEINNTYLELKIGNPNKSVREQIENDEELQKFLEATTLAIFDELSVSENLQSKLKDKKEFNQEIIEKNRKSDVIDFLSKLGWINSTDQEKQPLISLNRSNISQSNLSSADLIGADLSEANLSNSDLSYADLIGADLSEANLSDSYLSKAFLREVNLSNSDLSFANLLGASMREAKLRGAFLKEANLSYAFLGYASLGYAKLIDANLKGASLKGAKLTDADLSGANLTDADLTDANLTDANLTDANLTDANLTDANLTDANLYGADLYSANLTDADLSGANLFVANLSNDNIDRAIFCKTTMPDRTINNRDCEK